MPYETGRCAGSRADATRLCQAVRAAGRDPDFRLFFALRLRRRCIIELRLLLRPIFVRLASSRILRLGIIKLRLLLRPTFRIFAGSNES